MVLNYDVSAPEAWQGGVLYDTMGSAPPQTALPTPTEEQLTLLAGLAGFNSSVSRVGEFGLPEFVEKQGPGGRSYLSFQMLGGLSAVDVQKPEFTSGALMNSDGRAGGYTMEMLVRIRPDFRQTMQGAIGGGGETSLENSFLGLAGERALTGTTVFEIGGEMPTNENQGQSQIITELPFDEIVVGDWVHLVKVHDPAAKVMTFYINGQPVVEDDLSALPEIGEYPSRAEYLRILGDNARRMSGVDFSFLRVYRGAMTAQDVGDRYKASSEPVK